jgi:hypothetical protein
MGWDALQSHLVASAQREKKSFEPQMNTDKERTFVLSVFICGSNFFLWAKHRFRPGYRTSRYRK